MKLALKMISIAMTMAHRLTVVSAVSAPMGFRQIGQTLQQQDVDKYGSNLELSDDGKRMVVAAEGTSITVFDRDDSTAPEDITDATWEPRLHLPFGAKGCISLSGDGKILAVRRQATVEIFHIDTNRTTSVDACPGPSQNVHIGQTKRSSIFGSVYWLLVGCESYNQHSGKVDIFFFDNDESTWLPFTTIFGEHPGARFGWESGFNVFHDLSPMIAVSSPFYGESQGLVQVFSLSHTSGFTQQGRDIVGQASGDKFGFSLAMSTTELPHLVVGAPDCSGRRGCVYVYDWSREGFGKGHDWNQVGLTITGEEEQENFGRAVAISKDGNRVAASSVRKGMVRLFEHGSDFTPIGIFEGDAISQWGFDISLNDSGSMLVSGSIGKRSRSVQVFVEEKPFCSHPIREYSNTQLFLTRSQCRTQSGDLVTTERDCAKIHSYDYGTSCKWISNLGTRTPSSMPSLSSMPSSSPSTAPSSSPSASPSRVPSAMPSRIPSTTPSASRTSTPFPSSMPSASPIASSSCSPSAPCDDSIGSPSQDPMLGPSGSPSSNPSFRPSSGPSASSQPSAEPSNKKTQVPLIGLMAALVPVCLLGAKFFGKGKEEEEIKATSIDTEFEKSAGAEGDNDLEAQE